MADDLVLRVEGLDLAGWTSIQITRSIDQLADTFDLAISTSKVKSIDLAEGERCSIVYRGETVLDGYIDDIDISDDATSSSMAVVGRSRAADLVDCSAIHKPWRNTPGLTIAQELCEPFGIDVSLEPATSTLAEERYFKVSDGETVYDCLDRLARLNGSRICSYPDGSIRFTRTGLLRYPDVVIARGVNVVARGVNVVSARVHRSMAERYSDYIFKAQLAADDETYGEAANALKYEVRDEGCGRYRPLVVRTETQPRNTKGQFVEGKLAAHPLEMAATWERNTRGGRSLQLEYSVCNPRAMNRSWEHAHGIWEPNTIVTVFDDVHDIDGEFLVTSVTLARDGNGTRTVVSLTHPEAYDVKVPPKKKKKKKGYTF